MRSETGWRYSVAAVVDQSTNLNSRPQRLLAGAALTCIGALCAWTLIGNLYGNGGEPDGFAARFDSVARIEGAAVRRAGSAFADRFDGIAARGDRLAAKAARVIPSSPALSNAYASLFDRRFSLGYAPGGFTRSVAVASNEDSSPAQTASIASDAAAPLPLPRPRLLSRLAALTHSGRTADAPAQDAAQETAQQHEPTLFERLFGKPKPVALAYASSDDAGLGRPVNIVARYDRQTAVYDISAKTVYMPDGRRLEAHSGLGQYLDDPRHVDLRMHGATPPTIYDLSVRDGLFHGVRALRLTPEDESKVYGRAGLLAHTFMLGPNGDSNGCVSFRNYDVFLQAYLSHEVTKLAVVSSLD